MPTQLTIQIILGSTRIGRQGKQIAQWIAELAQKRSDWQIELIDLNDWPLPFFNEPKPPKAGEYTNELAKKWVDKVAEADGYIIVTPEYNHGYPAVLKNALDYPYYSWNRKPVGFISYSVGSAGGIRAVEQLRQVVIELAMAPIRQQLAIEKNQETFDSEGRPLDPSLENKAELFFNELLWWTRALKTARDAER